MHLRLKRVRFIVPQLDQELPRGEPRHRRPCGVHVIDASRLECKVRRWRGDVLGISSALAEAWKANHAENFIADGEALYIRGDRLDNARHVRPRNDGHGHGRPPLRRQVRISVAQVPVRGIDAGRVNANEHLTRLQLGNRRLFVTQHLRATELV